MVQVSYPSHAAFVCCAKSFPPASTGSVKLEDGIDDFELLGEAQATSRHAAGRIIIS